MNLLCQSSAGRDVQRLFRDCSILFTDDQTCLRIIEIQVC
jgi:hypothetical protein